MVTSKAKGSSTSKSVGNESIAKPGTSSKLASKETTIKASADPAPAASNIQKANTVVSDKPKPITQKTPATQKAPPAGTLDWSKAKTKSTPKETATNNTAKAEEKLDDKPNEVNNKVAIIIISDSYFILIFNIFSVE